MAEQLTEGRTRENRDAHPPYGSAEDAIACSTQLYLLRAVRSF